MVIRSMADTKHGGDVRPRERGVGGRGGGQGVVPGGERPPHGECGGAAGSLEARAQAAVDDEGTADGEADGAARSRSRRSIATTLFVVVHVVVLLVVVLVAVALVVVLILVAVARRQNRRAGAIVVLHRLLRERLQRCQHSPIVVPRRRCR